MPSLRGFLCSFLFFSFCRTANMVLCMLVLHNCQSRLNVTPDSDEQPSAATNVSALHAQGENRSLLAESSAISSTLGSLNPTTISHTGAASQGQRVPPRAMLYTPASMAPSVRVVRPTDLHTYLSSDSCVYLDIMGLLRGMPVLTERIEHFANVSITLASNETRTEVHHIPLGYRYKSYRVKQDSEQVMQGASWTIYYVEAQSPGEISKLAESINGGELEAKLAADFVNVVILGKLGGGSQHGVSNAHQDMRAPNGLYAALVVHGDRTTTRSFHEKNQIRLEFEIILEELEELEEATEKYKERQIPFQEEMLTQSKHYGEQANKSKKEIDASFGKEDGTLSIEMLSLEERAKLECECDKKLSAVQQEKVAEQEDSEKEAQTALGTPTVELSTHQVPEQQQLQAARLPAIAFGASAWKKYYGEVDEEPRLPDNIEDILNRPCPF